MGLVADTSVFTTCERRRWTATRISTYLSGLYSSEIIVIPSIGAAELVHGIFRSNSPAEFNDRQQHVHALLTAYTVVSFTDRTAWIAGKLRDEHARTGNTLPLADSLIAAVALELGFSVLTHNVKDFVRIPNLHVIPFTLP